MTVDIVKMEYRERDKKLAFQARTLDIVRKERDNALNRVAEYERRYGKINGLPN